MQTDITDKGLARAVYTEKGLTPTVVQGSAAYYSIGREIPDVIQVDQRKARK